MTDDDYVSPPIKRVGGKRTVPHDMDAVLASKNDVIASLTAQNTALLKRVDQLQWDLRKSEQFIEYLRFKLTGVPSHEAF